MTDFRKIAADARVQHDAAEAEKEAKRAKERQDRIVWVEQGKALLEDNLVPLLEAARRDVAAEGIELAMERHYEVQQFASANPPTITLFGKGPKRPSDGWQWTTAAMKFIPRDDGIELFQNEDNYSRSGKGKTLLIERPDECSKLVDVSMQLLVKLYFEELARH